MEHSDEDNGIYWPHKLYKFGGFNPNYDEDLKKYDAWLDECLKSINEATRAANWFADAARRDINPMFFAARGKFLIVEGSFMDLNFHASAPEFKKARMNDLPNSLLK
jgi:hypothetical protein